MRIKLRGGIKLGKNGNLNYVNRCNLRFRLAMFVLYTN